MNPFLHSKGSSLSLWYRHKHTGCRIFENETARVSGVGAVDVRCSGYFEDVGSVDDGAIWARETCKTLRFC